MSRKLFATVNVYEEHENGEIELLHEKVRLDPDVYDHVTEDGIKFALQWFHLRVTTYEGKVTDHERNN